MYRVTHISRNRTIFRYAPNETGGTAKNPIKTGSLSQRKALQDRATVVQPTCDKCMYEGGCSAAGQRARHNFMSGPTGQVFVPDNVRFEPMIGMQSTLTLSPAAAGTSYFFADFETCVTASSAFRILWPVA